MDALLRRLYPICRSISGAGVRETIDVLARRLPLQRVGVPTGTRVHDWTIGDEWNVRDAWIADAHGRRVVDFKEHNLHLVSYSEPVRVRLSLDELRPHLFTLPDHPDWIPYRTSYYHRSWGFCLPQRRLEAMEAGEFPGPYEVVVDSTLAPGELTYAELAIPGELEEEVLFTAHLCHPSIANDNLSGLAVATELATSLLSRSRRRYSYRFLFAPGTIGSLAWLSRNHDRLGSIRHGLVLTGLGGPGHLVYKQTRRGDRTIDRVLGHVVAADGGEVRGYSPYGYDERQFNALGFDLPVGRLSRTPHGEYPEYHTSADDLDYVKPSELLASYAALVRVVDVLEEDRCLTNLSPYGEPQLGARGLYPTMGGKSASDQMMAMLWLLGYSDGATSLLEVAEISGLGFDLIRAAADDLTSAGLLGESAASSCSGSPDLSRDEVDLSRA